MNIPWSDHQIFVQVAESESFSEAARRLGLTQPTVSRRIAALEARVGRPLFRRDRKGAHLTAEGRTLLQPAEQMARWALELERQTSSFEQAPTGRVTVACAPGFAFEFLVPFAASVREKNPALFVDVVTGIETMDLTRGEADLAIRVKAPSQNELQVLATASFELGIFASASLRDSLREKHGEALKASQLPWVTWGYPLSHVSPRPELAEALDPFTIGFASNDYLAQQRAVECGLGAMIFPKVRHRFSPWRDLVALEVRVPFPDRRAQMHVVCARSMRRVPRVRAVFDLLREEFGKTEGLLLEVFD